MSFLNFFKKKEAAEEISVVDAQVKNNEEEKDEVEEHRQITVVVIGAGQRGNVYATYSRDFPQRMRVVGIAEPQETRRRMFSERFNVPQENAFKDWKDVASREKFADAIVIATLDDLHHEPCLAFADLKYHILCEKPMATTEHHCEEMVASAKKNNVILAFGHVMRYTHENMRIKQLIEEGAIGDLVGIQHHEPVGWRHFAHSYVRGNWKRTQDDCGSLMAKSCHDLDLIKYFVGDARCVKIQSFGGLKHFTEKNKPKEAANRCLDCPLKDTCAYSAVKAYITNGFGSGFCYAVAGIPDVENLTEALRVGPYGKCVYSSDNDVCDHQTVSMEFENQIYATFTMSAFTEIMCKRKFTIHGTKGEIVCEGKKFSHFDFRTEKFEEFRFKPPSEQTTMSGHGFADYHLMKAFVSAVAHGDVDMIQSGPEDSLRGHKFVFAAEKSRLNGGETLHVDI